MPQPSTTIAQLREAANDPGTVVEAMPLAFGARLADRTDKQGARFYALELTSAQVAGGFVVTASCSSTCKLKLVMFEQGRTGRWQVAMQEDSWSADGMTMAGLFLLNVPTHSMRAASVNGAPQEEPIKALESMRERPQHDLQPGTVLLAIYHDNWFARLSYNVDVVDGSSPAAKTAASALQRTESALLAKRDLLRVMELKRYRQGGREAEASFEKRLEAESWGVAALLSTRSSAYCSLMGLAADMALLKGEQPGGKRLPRSESAPLRLGGRRTASMVLTSTSTDSLIKVAKQTLERPSWATTAKPEAPASPKPVPSSPSALRSLSMAAAPKTPPQRMSMRPQRPTTSLRSMSMQVHSKGLDALRASAGPIFPAPKDSLKAFSTSTTDSSVRPGPTPSRNDSAFLDELTAMVSEASEMAAAGMRLKVVSTASTSGTASAAGSAGASVRASSASCSTSGTARASESSISSLVHSDSEGLSDAPPPTPPPPQPVRAASLALTPRRELFSAAQLTSVQLTKAFSTHAQPLRSAFPQPPGKGKKMLNAFKRAVSTVMGKNRARQ